jgi:formylglycine-generating enzyme required for sulfatase activity
MAINGQGQGESSPNIPPSRPSWAAALGHDVHGYWAELTLDRVSQRLRFIPAGGFWMGSPDSEPGHKQDESRRWVALDTPFWLADTTCTQALWQAVTGQQPSQFRGEDLPVEQVSWDAVNARFLSELSRRLPGLDAMLPTEAQWEHACRAGTQTAFHWGDGPIPPDRAQHAFRQPRQTVPVYTFEPSAWGLWQMHGNVMEWCAHATDHGDRSDARVARGGSWNSNARTLRSACRVKHSRSSARNDLGFRLAVAVAAPAAG